MYLTALDPDWQKSKGKGLNIIDEIFCDQR